MMNVTPSPEHDWLRRLMGDWTFESDTISPEGTQTIGGSETVTAVGEVWIEARMIVEERSGNVAHNVLTLGFDTEKKRFVGAFVSSHMTKLWTYEGDLSADGRVLTLETEGPSFTGEGTARYRDVMEITDADNRVFYSEGEKPDGSWMRFQSTRYRRA
ncbi:DUF1579 domain-containing protein [Xanthobacteraceae bacterium A53D]